MERPLAIHPYPWEELRCFRRDDVALLRRLGAASRAAVDPARILQNLAELLGVHARLVGFDHEIERGEPPPEIGFSIGFETHPGGTRIGLELERDLVAMAVSSILGRPPPLADPRAPLDPALAGAAAAIAACIARRSHGERLLTPLGPGGLPIRPGEPRAVVHATIVLGQSAYRIRATVDASIHDVPPQLPDDLWLRRLGNLPLTLEVVAGLSAASRTEIAALGVGDIWLAGAGWTVKARAGSLEGEVLLAAPRSESALGATLVGSSEVVLGTPRRIPFDAESEMGNATTKTEKAEGAPAAGTIGSAASTSGAGSSPAVPVDGASDAVVDAPVVVRVELSAVTLSAREWAATNPGDLLPLARPVGSLVTLRVAGLEVARGELVNIEGELGVRIRELVSGGCP